MKTHTITATKGLLWLSDIHLDLASDDRKSRFLDKLAALPYECVLITGDISNGRCLTGHLREIAEACAQRSVYFCLGNHDYYGSTFQAVARETELVCGRHANLHFLGKGEIIPLGRDTALIGHGGWADGRAGWGKRTLVTSRDHHSIEDFTSLSKDELFDRMRQLGEESAAYFRRVLPAALTFRHVIVATHVPPFCQAALYDGKTCGWTHSPHYSNLSAGGAILGIARNHPQRQITVLCGHTHSPARVQVLDHLEVRVGGAQRGAPAIQGMFEFN